VNRCFHFNPSTGRTPSATAAFRIARFTERNIARRRASVTCS
jgi:hypothetical protein